MGANDGIRTFHYNRQSPKGIDQSTEYQLALTVVNVNNINILCILEFV